MNETEFRVLADAAFDRLETALDACDAEIDWTQVGAGVVELEFANGSKIVVNRHAAAREIWVAAVGFIFAGMASAGAIRAMVASSSKPFLRWLPYRPSKLSV